MSLRGFTGDVANFSNFGKLMVCKSPTTPSYAQFQRFWYTNGSNLANFVENMT